MAGAGRLGPYRDKRNFDQTQKTAALEGGKSPSAGELALPLSDSESPRL